MKKLYFAILLLFSISAGVLAQDQASAISSAEPHISTLSFTTLYPNPFQDHFVLKAQEPGKIVVFDAEGTRMEEHYFDKDQAIELGSKWPKGHYNLKIMGRDRTDFTKIRKD